MDPILQEMVSERRRALSGADDGARPWGLALSGGGIRSATFCLGLLKALAAHRQLLRFDLLSTVSGGGYVGATLGRLCSGAASAEQVRDIERAFGHVERVRFGGWLRGNGRYLIPGGLNDILFAAALYLRNLLGTHIELAIAASLVGMVLAALNLLLWDGVFRAVDLDTATRDAVVDATALSAQEVLRLLVQGITRLPTLWFAAVGPLVASVALACAYWSVRDRPSSSAMLMQAGLWTALGTGACWIGPVLVARFSGPLWLTPVFVAFALCWVVALLWVRWRSRHRSATEMRNRLTDALASVLKTLLLIALLGVLDRSAWWMAADSRGQRASYGAVLLVLAAMSRAVLPTLLAQKHERPGIGKALLLTLASLLGLALAFCLAAWWIGVVDAAVLLPVFTSAGLDFSRGWVWLGTLFVIVGSYALVTGGNLAFLNLSSLHMFYRARIVRGYLGAANAGRLGGAPTDEVSGLALPQVPVGQVDAGDDISQLRYAPHAQGGPVHLLNVCINQTHDTRQRLFNRDRKGLPFTVGPLGWMQAGNADWARVHGDSVLTLGAWTAISGAAVASGLGRMTRRGLAALSVFAGLRLGYWWNSAEAGLLQRGAAARGSTLFMKTRFLLMECFGTFPGSGSAHWYLSDGGHFENTGVYALLRQQAALIVMADCGADPDYQFGDLENLIRRARIDLNAEITFMKPYPGAEWPPLDAFGSLNDLASITSQACLALAQVRYADGATGQIVLVKPNVSASLPVDLVNFKAANPLFPQQPTTDQFFDEAQWESYFQLGAEIGSWLDGELLDRVALGTIGLFVPDDGQPQPARPAGPVAGAGNDPAAPTLPATTATATAIGTMSRLQARVLRAGAVTASVGLGTAATFGVAAWQGIDSWRVQRAETERAENVAFKDLTERWARLRGGATPGEAPALLAADLLRTGDLLCREGSDNFMTKFRLSVRIVDDARQACAQGAVEQRAPACARLLDTGNGIDCLQPAQAPPCAPRYWARDYSGQTAPQHNCSGTVPEPWPVVMWLRGLGRREGDLRMAAVAPSPPAMTPVPGPVTAPAPGAGDVCKGTVVYIQTYGGALGAKARAWRGPWQALGATVPPIEDVLGTARQAGRSPPTGHAEPSVIIRDAAARACAEALTRTAESPTGQPWVVKRLPPSPRAAPGAIEVWLPRTRSPSAS